jgi:hypothetical protein
MSAGRIEYRPGIGEATMPTIDDELAREETVHVR